jgi:hypothetical protein
MFMRVVMEGHGGGDSGVVTMCGALCDVRARLMWCDACVMLVQCWCGVGVMRVLCSCSDTRAVLVWCGMVLVVLGGAGV